MLLKASLKGGCLRSQSYEFESNSQPSLSRLHVVSCCLRSQNYEFESNSQVGIITKVQRYKKSPEDSQGSKCFLKGYN